MQTKEIPQHLDKLGRPLKIGDCVAYPHYNDLYVGLIKKINPKMVRVGRIGGPYRNDSGYNKYPIDVVLLEGPDVTMYILKNSSK